MKSTVKFLLALFVSTLLLQSAVFAKDSKQKNDVPRKYRIEAYTKAVQKELGYKTEDYEQNIINVAYSYCLYYFQ